MSDHIPDPGKMPQDGYYGAVVTPSQGRPFHMAVRVCDGRVFSPNNSEFKPSVCSEFVPIATWNYCSTWPHFAADELDRLRAAVRALHAELQGGKFAAIPVEDILEGRVTL
jgi:hypothetical protein